MSLRWYEYMPSRIVHCITSSTCMWRLEFLLLHSWRAARTPRRRDSLVSQQNLRLFILELSLLPIVICSWRRTIVVKGRTPLQLTSYRMLTTRSPLMQDTSLLHYYLHGGCGAEASGVSDYPSQPAVQNRVWVAWKSIPGPWPH